MWAVRLRKTTLTRLVNGLIPNYYEGELTGEVLLDGKTSAGFRSMKQPSMWAAFSKSSDAVFTVDSTSELAFGCENQGLPESEITHRVKSTAVQFDMEDLLGKIFSPVRRRKQKLPALLFLSAIRLLSFRRAIL